MDFNWSRLFAVVVCLSGGGSWADPLRGSGLEVPRGDLRLSREWADRGALSYDSSGQALEGARFALSVDDLGFSKNETQADPKFQKDLEARSDMLKIHQTLGLITCVPMITTLVLGFSVEDEGEVEAEGEGSVLGVNARDLHVAMGITTAVLYATTASFAILAPKPQGVKSSGNTDLHQLLAVVHGAAMIATPILGVLAQENDDLTDTHFLSAATLVTSYVAAMAVMTF